MSDLLLASVIITVVVLGTTIAVLYFSEKEKHTGRY